MPHQRVESAVRHDLSSRAGILIALASLFVPSAKAIAGDGAAAPATPAYVVLSPNAILVRTSCGISGSAEINLIEEDGQSPEHFEASLEGLQEDQNPTYNWTLISLKNGAFRPSQKYELVIRSTSITNAPSCYADKPIVVDTNPKVEYVANSTPPNARPGTQGGRLVSTVAFSLPGDTAPVNLAGVDCKLNEPGCVDVTLDLGGTLIHARRILFNRLALATIIANHSIPSPQNIGKFSVKSDEILASARESRPGSTVGGTLLNLTNVLAGGSKAPLPLTEGSLKASKAPTTKDQSWLWINGTITAGTGTAPAWVLDGKIDLPAKQNSGPVLWKFVTATANIGNNKIGGQTAKDVIDFSSPSATYIHQGKSFASIATLAPTYETNLALSHRNFIAAGDFYIYLPQLQATQEVRIAKAYFSKKTTNPKVTMPTPGVFPQGFPRFGWSFTPHVGFEAGGALASSSVTNPKTKAMVGIIPTYSIGRVVPQMDVLFKYLNFSLESYLTSRYLFSKEQTAVNDRTGAPYLETVSGWKAVNVLSFAWAPGANQHTKFTVAYTDGFSAPTYQRANGVKVGIAVAY